MNIDMHQLLLHIMNLGILAFAIFGIIWIARTIKKLLFALVDRTKEPGKNITAKDRHREDWERWKQEREYEEYLQWKREKDAANK